MNHLSCKCVRKESKKVNGWLIGPQGIYRIVKRRPGEIWNNDDVDKDDVWPTVLRASIRFSWIHRIFMIIVCLTCSQCTRLSYLIAFRYCTPLHPRSSRRRGCRGVVVDCNVCCRYLNGQHWDYCYSYWFCCYCCCCLLQLLHIHIIYAYWPIIAIMAEPVRMEFSEYTR